MAGMRGSSVGTDTGGYAKGYEAERVSTVADVWDRRSELGYFVLELAARSVSDNYWAILTASAGVVIFCYMWTIYRLSVNPAISLFVFITMGYYTFFFNGARQGLAAAVYCLAFTSLVAGRFWRYALFVAIAFLFHRTAILTLPLYFVFRRKCSFWYVAALMVGAGVVVCFLHVFLSLGVFINERYSMYAEMEATGGRWLTVFYVLLSVFFLLFKPAIMGEDRRAYDCFLNMLIFGTTVYVGVATSGAYVELTRFAFYFQVGSVFLWPLVFKSGQMSSPQFLPNASVVWTRQKGLLPVSVHPGLNTRVPPHTSTGLYVKAIPIVLGHLAYFYLFLSQIGNLVPYRLNEEIARWGGLGW
ncbi:MAG: EpsG family protein [Phycisphaerae bacterium]|nr:EpsG family protein [Phycisphaerae bacterium]